MALRAKNTFFDTAAIIKAMNRATNRSLSMIGAFLRQRGRTSMRYSKGPSAPGSPPHAHNPPKLRQFLNMWVDMNTAHPSVIAGSEKLDNTKYAGSIPLPRLHEVGGEAPYSRSHSGRLAKYPARPYMGPALQAEIQAGTIPNAWKNSIQGP